MTIQARYSGCCDACDNAFRAGELIKRDPLTESWQHAKCPQEQPREVCEECWMEKAANGACSCI